MSEAKPQSSLSAFIPVGFWLVPALIGVLITKANDANIVANVIGICLFVVTWLGWASLCLKLPREPEPSVPPIFDRLIVTLKLTAVVLAAAIVTGIAFARSVDPAVLSNFAFLIDVAGYLVLFGIVLGVKLLLVNAYQNRARSQPMLRCAIDTLDISLTAVSISVASVTVLFVVHLTGLGLPSSASVIAAMIMFGTLFAWRIGPYLLRGLLLLQLWPWLNRWAAR